MPNRENYDFSYRPQSYWGPQELKAYYGSRIKGELRREAALKEIDAGIADPGVLCESLSREERDAVGSIHPWLMGGEYLPDLLPNEVEIARVVLESTTMDVKSIRARHTKHRIIYRIVDEYPEDGVEFIVRPKTGTRPTTFGQLIEMIDGAEEGGLVGSGRDHHFDELGSDPEEIYNFETASSAFYPQLAAWYDEVNQEWLDSKRRELEQEEREAEELERRKANDPLFLRISDWATQAWFEHPKAQSPVEAMARSWDGAIKRKSVEAYVTAHHEKFNCLPIGTHSVPKFASLALQDFAGEFEVRFPDNLTSARTQ